MRLLTLTAAATILITGTAMAKETHHHHDANASVAEDSIPADSISAHEAHMKNLQDSGYNPRNDFDANGNTKGN